MLKKSEITALAGKLKWDVETTNKCIEDLFSDDSEVIDGNIVKDKTVCDFLRICTKSKFYPINDQRIYKFFRDTFTGDIEETLIYFYNDYFFGPIIDYLRRIEKLSIDNTIKTDVDDYPIDHSFYNAMTCTQYSTYFQAQKSIGFPIEVLILNYSKKTKQDETFTAIELVSKLIPKIGFKVFQSEYMSFNIVELHQSRSYKELRIIANNLLSYCILKTKQDPELIYCLCYRLWLEDYGRRESFRIAGACLNIPYGSAHRRFYDVQEKLKKKGLRYEDIVKDKIKIIDHYIEEIKRYKDVSEYVKKISLTRNLTQLDT